jgi:hypothetical protein
MELLLTRFNAEKTLCEGIRNVGDFNAMRKSRWETVRSTAVHGVAQGLLEPTLFEESNYANAQTYRDSNYPYTAAEY